MLDANPERIREDRPDARRPLTAAAEFGRMEVERPDMLKVLLERGGLDPDYPTEDGVTLLHELCHRDIRGRTLKHRTQCAEILLAAGAQLSPTTRAGMTPLAWAIRHDLTDMVAWLNARGAA